MEPKKTHLKRLGSSHDKILAENRMLSLNFVCFHSYILGESVDFLELDIEQSNQWTGTENYQ